MKKFLYIIAILLASASFISCGSGEDDPIVNPGGNTGGGGTGTGGGTDNPGGGTDTPGGGTDNPGGEEQKETKPTWTLESTAKFEHTMSVWICISGGSSSDALSVFYGAECRGIGEIITNTGSSQLWCILVYGSGDETSNMTVKYWNDNDSKTYSSSNTFSFTPDSQYGTADKPTELTFK